MGKVGLFDLEKQFAFYGAYHSNPINIFLHMLFVWPILFSSLVLLYFTPPLFNLPHLEFSPFGYNVDLILNIGFFLGLVYASFYIAFDKKAGFLAALLCFFCWVSSSYLAGRLGFSLAWKVALAAQLFCWTGQFIGHGVFEKRAPALLDNLFQAFLMAPFFVLLEALQMLCGYEPYPGFHAKVQAKVEADIKEWKAKISTTTEEAEDIEDDDGGDEMLRRGGRNRERFPRGAEGVRYEEMLEVREADEGDGLAAPPPCPSI
ncbi:hypothetical protein NE237_019961 [Protea cynaroides]|uniref:Uncharacterized protein n=1 Tax=Protea cynaroides TaxID=273540 RepID=A0A9Q0H539_9MAGN|nr:hypothetical protein NE237_019961 [Protea cynaroides]